MCQKYIILIISNSTVIAIILFEALQTESNRWEQSRFGTRFSWTRTIFVRASRCQLRHAGTHTQRYTYIRRPLSILLRPSPPSYDDERLLGGRESPHDARIKSTNGESKRIANRRRLTTLNNFTSRDFVNRRIHSVYVYLCSINHERSSSRNNRWNHACVYWVNKYRIVNRDIVITLYYFHGANRRSIFV